MGAGHGKKINDSNPVPLNLLASTNRNSLMNTLQILNILATLSSPPESLAPMAFRDGQKEKGWGWGTKKRFMQEKTQRKNS